jgi:hypothetical protein
MVKLKWVKIHTSSPELFVSVWTLLFNGNIIRNSIQLSNIQSANGKLIKVRQWYKENLYVTHWLAGMPDIPDPPKRHKQDYEKDE